MSKSGLSAGSMTRTAICDDCGRQFRGHSSMVNRLLQLHESKVHANRIPRDYVANPDPGLKYFKVDTWSYQKDQTSFHNVQLTEGDEEVLAKMRDQAKVKAA